MKHTLLICLLVSLVMLPACETSPDRGEPTHVKKVMDNGIDKSDVGEVLDWWHHAASVGDIDSYIGMMTDGAVFMGTDAKERWTRDEFEAFARPHFADGHGWTYKPRNRYMRTNAYGDVAWVDEILDHETYGQLRGTAVLRQNGEVWKISHYSMTFLIPNDKVGEVLKVIQPAADHTEEDGGSMDGVG